MLVIRLQRTGRSGHAMFRIVVQDTRQTPTSGRVIAALGNYNPHTKEIKLDADKAKFYLSNGAQPSDRIAAILKKEGIKLPSWVSLRAKKSKKAIKHIDKLRKNRPAGEAPAAKPAEAKVSAEESEMVEVPEAEEPAEEAKPEESTEPAAEEAGEAPAEETPEEAPAVEEPEVPEEKVSKE
ncbi:MAG TPA: 30S ribosomal protein S16 [Patescibacteria group bacterium]|nr:30S ribosomal protein S16 [Patescibacteria group bacterium]